ncbi:MAG TPA: NAD(P)H-quinone oxidoreductase [Polyangiaceae bacterium]
MRAVLARKPGGPEVLELVEVPAPSPNPHQVLIDVHAAALNRADLLQRRGLYPPPAGESDVLGMECAGVVSRVGTDVRTLSPGDRVMALLGSGGYAEQVAIHEKLAVKIPDNLSFEAAAAIPEAFVTAQQALLDAGALGPGERVLIHAGASGIGSAAIQVARELGAYVFATTRSEHKLTFLRTLGVERAIHVGAEDFAEVIRTETREQGVDVLVDFVGAAYAEKNHAVLATGGRWVVVGLLGGARATIDLGKLLARRQVLAGIVLRTRSLPEKTALLRAFRRDLLPWFEDGRLRPILDTTYPLEEVVRAHTHMEQNENVGKIVLRVR